MRWDKESDFRMWSPKIGLSKVLLIYYEQQTTDVWFSYDMITDKGHMITHYRRYLRPLHPEHDPKLQKNDNSNEAIKTDDYILHM